MSAPHADARISLRISVTDRCDLRCVHCMPPGEIEKKPRSGILSFEEIVRFVRTMRAAFGLRKVHLTGGEPLLRTGLADLVAVLAAEGVGNIALTTNGQGLAEAAGELGRAGLCRVNVSLPSLDPEAYAALTRGGELAPAIEGIDAAPAAGLAPVKLNAVVLRGYNDAEVGRIARFGLARGCEVRFLELMPLGAARARFEELFVPESETRSRLAERFDLEPLPVEPAASSRAFLVRDKSALSGRVGFISPVTRPFCAGCRRLRLTAAGHLIGCLARGVGLPVRCLLRAGDGAGLIEAAGAALGMKRARPPFDSARLMAAVGG